MITNEFALRFSQERVTAWNSHDLQRVLSHYSDDFEMSSPLIVKIAGEPSGTLKGKAAISAYWQKALALAPALRFSLKTVLSGANSITRYYEGGRGLSAEVFIFNEQRQVVEAFAHYEISVS